MPDGLSFERPILEMIGKIDELKNLSAATGMDLGGEIRPLEERCERKTREIFASLNRWQKVQLARHPKRPMTEDFVRTVFEEFVELHGDRLYGDDKAILTGFARLDGRKVLLVAHRKGRDTKERQTCNFGCAHPEGYRKALHKMKMAERFGLPIIALINTPGAYPGIGAEERGQAWAIAENIMEMSTLAVPIVVAVIGEGGSGGALGIGIGDRVLIMEHAYYSVISPEGCAAILFRDGEKASEAAEALRLTAEDLKGFGIVDEIITEPLGGAHRDHASASDLLRQALVANLEQIVDVPRDQLVADRYDRIRGLGRLFRGVV
ncbi:MAG: acetyl-CoA carboxylase carboxyltransferase subunit alpha [Planctomycetota bacterium]